MSIIKRDRCVKKKKSSKSICYDNYYLRSVAAVNIMYFVLT